MKKSFLFFTAILSISIFSFSAIAEQPIPGRKIIHSRVEFDHLTHTERVVGSNKAKELFGVLLYKRLQSLDPLLDITRRELQEYEHSLYESNEEGVESARVSFNEVYCTTDDSFEGTPEAPLKSCYADYEYLLGGFARFIENEILIPYGKIELVDLREYTGGTMYPSGFGGYEFEVRSIQNVECVKELEEHFTGRVQAWNYECRFR